MVQLIRTLICASLLFIGVANAEQTRITMNSALELVEEYSDFMSDNYEFMGDLDEAYEVCKENKLRGWGIFHSCKKKLGDSLINKTVLKMIREYRYEHAGPFSSHWKRMIVNARNQYFDEKSLFIVQRFSHVGIYPTIIKALANKIVDEDLLASCNSRANPLQNAVAPITSSRTLNADLIAECITLVSSLKPDFKMSKKLFTCRMTKPDLRVRLSCYEEAARGY